MSNEDRTPLAPDTISPPTTSAKGWMKAVLVFSLALNLLFIGGILGAGWMRHKHGSGRHGGPPDFVIKHLLKHLPDDKQQVILARIAAHRQVLRPVIATILTRRKELKEALGAEPFSSARVREAALQLNMSRRAILDAKTELLVRILEPLTATERRKILRHRMFRTLFSRRGR
ncbi:MAG: periplasmic heavy metal sensor [Hyphomicrobiaceae bacterium]|nr:periplasmic heavy metal sensor [Hyphomicrobiaceae bacterium]